MGTSSSNPGPKGKRSPLPPWSDKPHAPNFPAPKPNTSQKEVNPNSLPNIEMPPPPATSWSSPKRGIGDFSKNPSRENFNKLGGGYVRASGGSKSASSSARSGKRVTTSVAGFFVSAVTQGLVKATQEYGLASFDNKNADTIAAEIIDVFAPAGATLEDAAARNALIATLKEFFKEIDIENSGIEVFDKLTEGNIQKLIEISISNYINERLQIELLNRVERKTMSEKQANKICRQIKKFIAGSIKIDLKKKSLLEVNWKGSEGKRLIEQFFQQGYELLGEE
ncbi:MAG: hypothetical protein JNM24_06670 [Bdellovibrionaceae bacterium]|nr:hypothetical protein [Pseudobdellovibrionaceae bacterium]